MNDLPAMESDPQGPQMQRLEDFLDELAILTRKYKIVLRDPFLDAYFHDVENDTLIGVGLALWLTPPNTGNGPPRLDGYDAENSILDGTWLIDTDDGPIEQRDRRPPWPARKQRRAAS